MSLSLYEIANRPALLARMTQEQGKRPLTYEEQLEKLDSMMARRKRRSPSLEPNPLDRL